VASAGAVSVSLTGSAAGTSSALAGSSAAGAASAGVSAGASSALGASVAGAAYKSPMSTKRTDGELNLPRAHPSFSPS
jgi:hypothetical protein